MKNETAMYRGVRTCEILERRDGKAKVIWIKYWTGHVWMHRTKPTRPVWVRERFLVID